MTKIEIKFITKNKRHSKEKHMSMVTQDYFASFKTWNTIKNFTGHSIISQVLQQFLTTQ